MIELPIALKTSRGVTTSPIYAVRFSELCALSHDSGLASVDEDGAYFLSHAQQRLGYEQKPTSAYSVNGVPSYSTTAYLGLASIHQHSHSHPIPIRPPAYG